MPLCMCGHEDHEHSPDQPDRFRVCLRDYCSCASYRERPGYAATTSFSSIPVSQGARDLMERLENAIGPLDPNMHTTLHILAAADEKDVRNLLWARRMGKL